MDSNRGPSGLPPSLRLTARPNRLITVCQFGSQSSIEHTHTHTHTHKQHLRWAARRAILQLHTPSIAFHHLPPNSARFSYATEGALKSPRSCPATRSARLRKLRVLNYMTVEATSLAPKHARKRETHPPRAKERVLSRFKRLWFYLCWCKLC